MSPPLSFPAPQLSHFALHHPDLLQAPPQPSSLLHASASAPHRPSGSQETPGLGKTMAKPRIVRLWFVTLAEKEPIERKSYYEKLQGKD